MLKNVMGIIELGESDEFLKELTLHRSLAAVPFGGRYRLIDFTLSNMVNAGIRNVGIFVKHQYRSLMDHLGMGNEWDLDRQRDGLFILPPPKPLERDSTSEHDVDLLYPHLDYLERSREELVFVSGTSMLCNMDLTDVLDFHRAKEADITMLYSSNGDTRLASPGSTFLNVSEDGRVHDIEVGPLHPSTKNVSMKMFLMKKNLLMGMLDQAESRGDKHLVKDTFIKHLRDMRIYGYPFEGYVGRINSLESYFGCSMDLLRPEIWQELFFSSGSIYTKVKNEPPVRYNEGCTVRNSLIANGCVIEGHVENSVLFRGVKVHKGAAIKNSIIMQKGEINSNALLEYVILDKDSTVTNGKHLLGDRKYPLVIAKRTIL